MNEVLTPEQCVKMRLFLGTLLAAAKTLPPGQRPDVTCFIREWRKYMAGHIKSRKSRHSWSDCEDAELLRLRSSGESWRRISERIGKSIWAIKARYRQIQQSQR